MTTAVLASINHGRTTPVIFHQPRHVQPEKSDSHHARHKLPVIPDLRFEYSYLRSVLPFVKVERADSASGSAPTRVEEADGSVEKEDEARGESGSKGKAEGEPQNTVQAVDKGLMEEGYETLDASLGFSGKEKEEGFAEGSVTVSSGSSEVITVQWKKVLWVTMRDQVVSPLLQGALWALASYYINPFGAQLGTKMGTFVREHRPTREGLGVGWLRSWGQGLGLGRNHVTPRTR